MRASDLPLSFECESCNRKITQKSERSVMTRNKKEPLINLTFWELASLPSLSLSLPLSLQVKTLVIRWFVNYINL